MTTTYSDSSKFDNNAFKMISLKVSTAQTVLKNVKETQFYKLLFCY